MSEGTALHLLDDAPTPDPARARPAVARVLQGAGANLILFSFAPGQSLPDHHAAHPITVQCLRGDLDFTWGGRTVRLAPGTVVHLPAYVTHRVDCPAEDGEAADGAAGGDPAPDDAAARLPEAAATEATGASSVLLLTMLTGEPA